MLRPWNFPKYVSLTKKLTVRKVRESLEIDMVVVMYGQDKVLNRDNGNFVKTTAWKPLFKYSIEIWRHFVLINGFALYLDQFENGFN